MKPAPRPGRRRLTRASLPALLVLACLGQSCGRGAPSTSKPATAAPVVAAPMDPQQPPAPPDAGTRTMTLQPLSPVRHAFTSAKGKSINLYFFLPRPVVDDAAFRQRLFQLAAAERAREPEAADRVSVYLYEQTPELNAAYQGTADALRGVQDSHLLAYGRWRGDQADVFYIVRQGKVVFDQLHNTAVDPPWEFD